MTERFDYIIVGSGSAGSVLANRLSQDGTARILVLEAGGNDRNFWLKLPVGYFRTFRDPRFSRAFPTKPGEGDGHRGINWPRGRVVGGSSSINGLVYVRGQKQDYDDWAELGASGWSWSEVKDHFAAFENFTDAPAQNSGELEISSLRNANPACAAWLKAAEAYGLPYNDDLNGKTAYGVGPFHLTIGKRFRASAAVAFLKPALARRNVTLRTKCHVTRVLFEGRRAIGVEWTSDGQTHKAYADSEVILSAGAIQSPQILQLSGIGPAGVLKTHGIDVLVDSPEVGANLQDHYQFRTILRLNWPMSLNDEVRNPISLMRMGAEWALKGRGPLTVGAGQIGGTACTPHSDGDRPDIHFLVMPLSVSAPGAPLDKFSGFTTAYWLCHPRSRGYLQIKSADPFADPLIVPNYLSEDIDRNRMVEGLKVLRNIHSHPPFRELVDEELLPGTSVKSDADLLASLQQSGTTVFHPVGTCRMGRDKAAVLDPRLRVNGVDGLRVVDASVMPQITSGNTNAPTLMIGEKGASMIKGDRQLRNARHQNETLK